MAMMVVMKKRGTLFALSVGGKTDEVCNSWESYRVSVLLPRTTHGTSQAFTTRTSLRDVYHQREYVDEARPRHSTGTSTQGNTFRLGGARSRVSDCPSRHYDPVLSHGPRVVHRAPTHYQGPNSHGGSGGSRPSWFSTDHESRQ